jgi:hypothetical protein
MRDLLDQVAARQIRQGDQLDAIETKMDDHLRDHQ